MSSKIILACLLALALPTVTFAEDAESEFDPFAPNAEAVLEAFDQAYQQQTGLSAFESLNVDEVTTAGCYRESCAVFLDIDKATQSARLYLDGRLTAQWPVSTGAVGHTTPNFDKHPDGRIYQRYMSGKFPGGDYMGLGNMPYAIFIQGGFAVHGTPASNWPMLGRRASHGCIRLHPDNAAYLNGLVRRAGVRNTWILVH